MKANRKGNGGIAGLLLMHGEKLGIAVVLVGVGFLIYSALGIAGLPENRGAEPLREKVRQSRTRVEDESTNNWTRAVNEHADLVKIDKPLPKSNDMRVVPDAYELSRRGFDPAVVTPSAPRTDPILLAATGLLARGGVSRFAFEDDETRRKLELAAQQEEARQAAEAERQRLAEERENQAATRGRRNRGDRPRRGRGGDPREREEESGRGRSERSFDRGVASRGGVQLQGSELIQLTHWALVVAKAPIREQRSRYVDAFENTRGGYDDGADAPAYVGFKVQRAEVRGSDEALDWRPISVYDAKATPTRKELGKAMWKDTIQALDLAMRDWVTGIEPEVVDMRYLAPGNVLTYPLPPLVGRSWGAEATHPDIPLASSMSTERFEPQAVVQEQLPTTPGAGDELFSGLTGQTPGGFARDQERRPEQRFTSPRQWQSGGGFQGRETYSGREHGREGYAGQGSLALGVDDFLVRFFDFTVEPGRKYTYRVQLVLFDPNLAPHVQMKDLAPAVQERIKAMPKDPATGRPKQPVVLAPPSDPSPTVSIPLTGNVLLAENPKASPGHLLGDNPKVKLMVESFNIDRQSGNWIQATKEAEFGRGSVANFVSDADVPADGPGPVKKVKAFEFFTGVTVLDMRGGDRLGRGDLLAPTRVLLMDAAGQLSVRRELNDAADVAAHRAAIPAADADVFDRPQR